jgi:trans-aconitate methyltransferase
MDPVRWIPPDARDLLDVGCNAGELLGDLRDAFPLMRLAGVDVNAGQIEVARARVADVEVHQASAEPTANSIV